MTPHVAPHQPSDEPEVFELPPVILDFEIGDFIELGYIVGGGGGHELHITDASLKLIKDDRTDPGLTGAGTSPKSKNIL